MQQEKEEKKEIKSIWIVRKDIKEIKLSLLTDNMILYAENPKKPTKKNY